MMKLSQQIRGPKGIKLVSKSKEDLKSEWKEMISGKFWRGECGSISTRWSNLPLSSDVVSFSNTASQC